MSEAISNANPAFVAIIVAFLSGQIIMNLQRPIWYARYMG